MAHDQTAARRHFFRHILPDAIFTDPTAFYDAFSESDDALIAYFTALWKTDADCARFPFFPFLSPFVLEDTEDGFCALLLLTLCETAAAKETAGALVFGSAMDPRVFSILPFPLKNGETAAIFEEKAGQDLPGEQSLPDERHPLGVLYQGCDNDLQLFDPPTPQPLDKDTPLDPARREAAAVDQIVCWCLAND